jgi:hypothetical protein
LPYSVERSVWRNNALKAFYVASLHLDGRVTVTLDVRITFLEDTVYEEPLTLVLMQTKIVTLLIQAKRFLEIMVRAITPPMVHTEASAKPSS